MLFKLSIGFETSMATLLCLKCKIAESLVILDEVVRAPMALNTVDRLGQKDITPTDRSGDPILYISHCISV